MRTLLPKRKHKVSAKHPDLRPYESKLIEPMTNNETNKQEQEEALPASAFNFKNMEFKRDNTILWRREANPRSNREASAITNVQTINNSISKTRVSNPQKD
ncbi:hypothetical protein YC2023_111452 [Brassica napus]